MAITQKDLSRGKEPHNIAKVGTIEIHNEGVTSIFVSYRTIGNINTRYYVKLEEEWFYLKPGFEGEIKMDVKSSADKYLNHLKNQTEPGDKTKIN